MSCLQHCDRLLPFELLKQLACLSQREYLLACSSQKASSRDFGWQVRSQAICAACVGNSSTDPPADRLAATIVNDRLQTAYDSKITTQPRDCTQIGDLFCHGQPKPVNTHMQCTSKTDKQ